MPIALPTTESLATPTNHDNRSCLARLRARFFPTLDFSSTPGRSVAAILVIRCIYNIVFFVFSMLGRRIGVEVVATLLLLFDPLIMAFFLGLIAEAQGERKILGAWIGHKHFDAFLLTCAAIHVLYLVYLLFSVVSFAIFFGYGLGPFLTYVGAAVAVVAFLAWLPPADEDGTLSVA
ncbi:hypothetical protein MMYC01_204167 [Madurella mycetomatis]|uniref:Uncharacterized protein n=1 Tax=Madurella mycetomatis TaxID=100816 RepID=A0A175VY28_9PEZI|nr:hypothetical protein MMYC01_206753 [Madurella mycetomatis]KXX79124.1 hypothetical protein MMYC01_204167 [Madurella mycetomatis]